MRQQTTTQGGVSKIWIPSRERFGLFKIELELPFNMGLPMLKLMVCNMTWEWACASQKEEVQKEEGNLWLSSPLLFSFSNHHRLTAQSYTYSCVLIAPVLLVLIAIKAVSANRKRCPTVGGVVWGLARSQDLAVKQLLYSTILSVLFWPTMPDDPLQDQPQITALPRTLVLTMDFVQMICQRDNPLQTETTACCFILVPWHAVPMNSPCHARVWGTSPHPGLHGLLQGGYTWWAPFPIEKPAPTSLRQQGFITANTTPPPAQFQYQEAMSNSLHPESYYSNTGNIPMHNCAHPISPTWPPPLTSPEVSPSSSEAEAMRPNSWEILPSLSGSVLPAFSLLALAEASYNSPLMGNSTPARHHSAIEL